MFVISVKVSWRHMVEKNNRFGDKDNLNSSCVSVCLFEMFFIRVCVCVGVKGRAWGPHQAQRAAQEELHSHHRGDRGAGETSSHASWWGSSETDTDRGRGPHPGPRPGPGTPVPVPTPGPEHRQWGRGVPQPPCGPGASHQRAAAAASTVVTEDTHGQLNAAPTVRDWVTVPLH